MNDEITALQRELLELKQRLARARRSADPQPVTGGYEFRTPSGEAVTLDGLFGDRDELLVVHNMGRGCPYCTLWADGLSGLAEHLADRFAFVLSSPDDPETLGAFASSRRWRFPVVSLAGNDFAKDMGFEQPEEGPHGRFMPGASAFRKNPDGTIMRTGMTFFGPGDDFCAIWPLMDLTPEGARGWEPKYTYAG